MLGSMSSFWLLKLTPHGLVDIAYSGTQIMCLANGLVVVVVVVRVLVLVLVAVVLIIAVVAVVVDLLFCSGPGGARSCNRVRKCRSAWQLGNDGPGAGCRALGRECGHDIASFCGYCCCCTLLSILHHYCTYYNNYYTYYNNNYYSYCS